MTSIADGHLRLAPSHSEEWDDIAGEWIEHAPQNLWRHHSDAVNTMLVERWLPAKTVDRILKTDVFDEAVAAGLYPALSRRARSVVALDVSPAIVSAASSRYPKLRSFGADVRSLPAASGSFDAIVSNSTLDHFNTHEDISTALRELHRVLRSRGTLILTLDNGSNPVIAMRNALPYSLTHAAGLVPYPVGRTYGPARACYAVEEAGFEVVEHTTVMHAPRVLAIPLMGVLDRLHSPKIRRRLLSAAMWFEKLQSFPTRSATGHFVAIRARKP